MIMIVYKYIVFILFLFNCLYLMCRGYEHDYAYQRLNVFKQQILI